MGYENIDLQLRHDIVGSPVDRLIVSEAPRIMSKLGSDAHNAFPLSSSGVSTFFPTIRNLAVGLASPSPDTTSLLSATISNLDPFHSPCVIPTASSITCATAGVSLLDLNASCRVLRYALAAKAMKSFKKHVFYNSEYVCVVY